MFTRNLALSVAAAALLSASALPAMAANPPLFFDFTTTYTAPLTTGLQTLTGRLSTNDAGAITGFSSLKLNGNPVVITTQASGSYSSAPVTTGYNPATAYLITSLQYGFNPGGAGTLPNPTIANMVTDPATLSALGPSGPAGSTFWIGTKTFTGGPPPNPTQTTITYQTVSFSALPEIDGGVLPKAMFVVAGAFLMFFGRNKHIEA